MMLIATSVRAIIAMVNKTLYIFSTYLFGAQNYNRQNQYDKICCRYKHKEANNRI